MNLAFLADENVETDIVDRLKSQGHVAVRVAELSPGRPDIALLQASAQAGQVLITADKDFGELIFRKHHRSAGVLFLRLPGMAPATKARLVADAVHRYGGALLGAFVVIGPRTIRLRRVPD